MNNDEIERHIAEAFARLREETVVPPVDPAREQALLQAFDVRRRRSPVHVRRWIWAGAAASIALAALLTRPHGPIAPSSRDETPASGDAALGAGAALDLSEFTAWPGASALPPFESGELMRVELPASSLPTFGVLMPQTAGATVQADIIVGQDGLARAYRVLQQ